MPKIGDTVPMFGFRCKVTGIEKFGNAYRVVGIAPNGREMVRFYA